MWNSAERGITENPNCTKELKKSHHCKLVCILFNWNFYNLRTEYGIFLTNFFCNFLFYLIFNFDFQFCGAWAWQLSNSSYVTKITNIFRFSQCFWSFFEVRFVWKKYNVLFIRNIINAYIFIDKSTCLYTNPCVFYKNF